MEMRTRKSCKFGQNLAKNGPVLKPVLATLLLLVLLLNQLIPGIGAWKRTDWDRERELNDPYLEEPEPDPNAGLVKRMRLHKRFVESLLSPGEAAPAAPAPVPSGSGSGSDHATSLSGRQQLVLLRRRSQRSPSVDFMGMSVSYPQYIRLRAIQQEVIKMDQLIRKYSRQYNHDDLARNDSWMELLELYEALKKMLPEDYLREQQRRSPIDI